MNTILADIAASPMVVVVAFLLIVAAASAWVFVGWLIAMWWWQGWQFDELKRRLARAASRRRTVPSILHARIYTALAKQANLMGLRASTRAGQPLLLDTALLHQITGAIVREIIDGTCKETKGTAAHRGQGAAAAQAPAGRTDGLWQQIQA